VLILILTRSASETYRNNPPAKAKIYTLVSNSPITMPSITPPNEVHAERKLYIKAFFTGIPALIKIAKSPEIQGETTLFFSWV
jgi:hypothetical protein